MRNMKLEGINEGTIEEIADSEAVLERGVDYFRSGRVDHVWFEGDVLCATVAGSWDYTTKVWTDGELKWECDCPYDGWCCKHVVAVLYQFLNQKKEFLKEKREEEEKLSAIGDQLMEVPSGALVEMIMKLIRANRDARLKLLKMLENESESEFIYVHRFEELWREIDPIIDRFGDYGGGPEEEEELVFKNLEEIVSMFNEGKLPQDVKMEFMADLLHYYILDNSGLEDMLKEALFDIAVDRSEWEFIIEKLQKDRFESHKNLIIKIYRDKLRDDENYLRERHQKLKSGLDYYDLSQFWYRKGEVDKAVEVAKEGLEKCEGRGIDLIDFLFNYYRGRDYSQALKYAVLKFEDRPSYSRYKELEKFCKKEDWAQIETECLEKLKEGDLAKVHWDKKEYNKVLEYVLGRKDDTVAEPFKRFVWGFFEDREKFADKLTDIYPNEILEFYKELVQREINKKERKSYRKAAAYAQKVKHIFIYELEKPEEWKKYIQSIRDDHPKRPALQDEFSEL